MLTTEDRDRELPEDKEKGRPTDGWRRDWITEDGQQNVKAEGRKSVNSLALFLQHPAHHYQRAEVISVVIGDQENFSQNRLAAACGILVKRSVAAFATKRFESVLDRGGSFRRFLSKALRYPVRQALASSLSAISARRALDRGKTPECPTARSYNAQALQAV